MSDGSRHGDAPGGQAALLAVSLRHRLGTLGLAIDFKTVAPWTILFGSSGSGKSTVLRAIAGLFRPRQARIVVGGRVVEDTDAGVHVPAHRRGVRWAGQTAMLFPRMTVRQNLAFAGDGRTAEALEHFGLEALAGKRPAELSGGERQRVSVVRAAVGASVLLLLDEPFSGLDSGLRDELLPQLRTWLGATPVVSVTHDVGEAFLLGAEVVRMSEGRVIAQGPVEVVLAEERARLRQTLG